MNTMRTSTIDRIVNKWLDVTISQKGDEGEKKCYMLHNEQLGRILVTNCNFRRDPRYYPNAHCYLIGSVELSLTDRYEIASFVADLNINPFDNSKGQLMLKRKF